MSLNHLLDSDSEGEAAEPGRWAGGEPRLLGLLEDTDEYHAPSPPRIAVQTESQIVHDETTTENDAEKCFDESVDAFDSSGIRVGSLVLREEGEEAEEEYSTLEWEENESEVNMVLGTSARSQPTTPKASSESAAARGPEEEGSINGVPKLPHQREMPATNVESHCNFKDEVIADSDSNSSAQYEELLPGFYFIGIHMIEVKQGHMACLVVVRPDVSANTLLDLVEQVLMSFGGAVSHYSTHDVTPLPHALPGKAGPQTNAPSRRSESKSSAVSTYPQQVREIRGVAATDSWDIISVFLGTDIYKRRVLCVHATPFTVQTIGKTVAGMIGMSWLVGSKSASDTSLSAESPTGGMVRKMASDMPSLEDPGLSPFQAAVMSLLNALMGALEEEHLTGPFIGQGIEWHPSKYKSGNSSSVGGNIADLHMQQLSGTSGAGRNNLEYNPPSNLVKGKEHKDTTSKVLDSLVDPTFVRDLMGSYAQELRYNLETVGASLDAFVAKLEMQCARLMTTLKPMYLRCGIAMPDPPPKKPLSAFPLVMPESQTFLVSSVVAEEASGVGLNLARLMILRARRAYMASHQEQVGGLPELRFVLTHIFRQLRRYSETEARARVLRKTDAVTARITDIESYRLKLLRTLHMRYESVISVISNSDHFSSVGKKLPAVLGAQESESMALYMTRFRIASYEEPPLIDFPACFLGMGNLTKKPLNLVSRWGHVYINQKDIMFYADPATIGSVLSIFSRASTSGSSDAIILVLPIGTIAKCNSTDKITDSTATAIGNKRDTAIELVDSAGNVYVFAMQVGCPPRYSSRICDLLTIIQSCALSGHDLGSNAVDNSLIGALSSSENNEKASSLEISGHSSSTKVDTAATDFKSESQLINPENSIFSTRKEAFSHVMKLASSALDAALPGKFRTSAEDTSKSADVTATIDASGHPNRHGDIAPKKKDITNGDVNVWYQSAHIGSSISIPTSRSVPVSDEAIRRNENANKSSVIPSTTQSVIPSKTYQDAKDSKTGISVPTLSGMETSAARPKPQSLGKNIQAFLKQQQQQQKS